MHLTLLIIFGILILIGAFSVFLFVFPAHLYLFIIILIYAYINGFSQLKAWEFAVLTIFVVIMIFIDYFSGLIGAKFSGASKKSIWLGTIGLVMGLIIFPPFGALIGLFLGILISEILSYKKIREAIKIASGSLLGNLAGILINFFLSLVILTLFIIFAKS